MLSNSQHFLRLQKRNTILNLPQFISGALLVIRQQTQRTAKLIWCRPKIWVNVRYKFNGREQVKKVCIYPRVTRLWWYL